MWVKGDKDSLPLKNKEAERRRCEYIVIYIQHKIESQCSTQDPLFPEVKEHKADIQI